MQYFVIYPHGDKESLNSFYAHNTHLSITITPIETYASTVSLRDELLRKKIISSNNKYNTSNLAIAQAHIALWEHAVKEQLDITIFETNTVTHKDFLQHQKNNLQLHNHYDVMIWGYNLDWDLYLEDMPGLPKMIYTFLGNNIEERKNLSNNELIDIPIYQNSTIDPQTFKAFSFAGMGCYTLSPNGSKQLLQQSLPIGNTPASGCQDQLHGSNYYIIQPIKDRPNISLDIEMNRHIESLKTYITIPMLAVIPTISKDTK